MVYILDVEVIWLPTAELVPYSKLTKRIDFSAAQVQSLSTCFEESRYMFYILHFAT